MVELRCGFAAAQTIDTLLSSPSCCDRVWFLHLFLAALTAPCL